jgi:hypothetical protein
MFEFDHFAIGTTDLSKGAADVEAALGVPLAPGGVHPAMGTHNRLLSLGPDAYLEVIAIDPDGQAPQQPRWFDLDRFAGPTRSCAWICRCPDLEAAIAAAPDGVGVPWDLARGDLSWRMAVPRDGKLPFDGLFPALIEWKGAAHPAPRLPDAGVRLAELRLISPQADALRAALKPLLDDARITVMPGDTPALQAVLQTPAGQVAL